jgi:hypothetical protein
MYVCYVRTYDVCMGNYEQGGKRLYLYSSQKINKVQVKSLFFGWNPNQDLGHVSCLYIHPSVSICTYPLSSYSFLRCCVSWNKPLNYLRITKLREQTCWDFYLYVEEKWGHAVAYLVEALCYKPEGRGFEPRWGGFFSVDLILPAALWPWVRLSL